MISFAEELWWASSAVRARGAGLCFPPWTTRHGTKYFPTPWPTITRHTRHIRLDDMPPSKLPAGSCKRESVMSWFSSGFSTWRGPEPGVPF